MTFIIRAAQLNFIALEDLFNLFVSWRPAKLPWRTLWLTRGRYSGRTGISEQLLDSAACSAQVALLSVQSSPSPQSAAYPWCESEASPNSWKWAFKWGKLKQEHELLPNLGKTSFSLGTGCLVGKMRAPASQEPPSPLLGMEHMPAKCALYHRSIPLALDLLLILIFQNQMNCLCL